MRPFLQMNKNLLGVKNKKRFPNTGSHRYPEIFAKQI